MKDKNEKVRIGIVGTIVSGESCDSWWAGKCAGAATILKELSGTGDVEVYINSQGGSVFAGFEILNALNAAVVAGRSVDIYISPLAASIASYISTGVKGATVYAASNAKLMYHAPWTSVVGSKNAIRDAADLLDKMEIDIKDAITDRGAIFDDEWFATGRMKWFSAKEALKAKLVDGIKDPPADLVSAISENESSYDDYYDKNDTPPPSNSSDSMLRMAASMEYAGYIKSQCNEHFEDREVIDVLNVTDKTFEIIFKNGARSLLNYQRDALNIINIEWDSYDPNNSTENEMTPEEKLALEAKAKEEADAKAKVEADAKAKEEADAKAKIEADAKAKEVADAKAKVEADAKAKEVADAKTKAALEANQLPEGFTADMVAWTKKNFQTIKDGHVAKIKANDNNIFTDEQLVEMTMDMLAGLAAFSETTSAGALAGTPASQGVDNSLINPNGSGDAGGSLKPPAL